MLEEFLAVMINWLVVFGRILFKILFKLKIAYRLFNETTGEAVRVLERDQRFRHLIKDFQHPTVDLQWATHAPLLAVLDANTNIYIYMVDNNGQKLYFLFNFLFVRNVV